MNLNETDEHELKWNILTKKYKLKRVMLTGIWELNRTN